MSNDSFLEQDFVWLSDRNSVLKQRLSPPIRLNKKSQKKTEYFVFFFCFCFRTQKTDIWCSVIAGLTEFKHFQIPLRRRCCIYSFTFIYFQLDTYLFLLGFMGKKNIYMLYSGSQFFNDESRHQINRKINRNKRVKIFFFLLFSFQDSKNTSLKFSDCRIHKIQAFLSDDVVAFFSFIFS